MPHGHARWKPNGMAPFSFKKSRAILINCDVLMAPSSPTPTIATNLTYTMNARNSPLVPKTEKARSLRLKLEEALNKSRSNTPLWTSLKYDNPNFKEIMLGVLDLAQARKYNEILKYHCRLGKYLNEHQDKIDLSKKQHVARLFLFDYFDEEEDAISYLEDVTIHNISYLSQQDRSTLLLLKPNLPNRDTPMYEPEKPDWIIERNFSPFAFDLSPPLQHHLGVPEMWRTLPETPISNKRTREDDAEELNPSLDEPLFLNHSFQHTVIATPSFPSNPSAP